jgi:hypothetical protein
MEHFLVLRAEIRRVMLAGLSVRSGGEALARPELLVSEN